MYKHCICRYDICLLLQESNKCSKAKLWDANVYYQSSGELLNRIFDGEAIRQFESLPYHDFAVEPRNLR